MNKMNPITQEEIDNLPPPPQEWIDDMIIRQELMNSIMNINYKKEFEIQLKKFTKDCFLLKRKKGGDGSSCNYVNSVYGNLKGGIKTCYYKINPDIDERQMFGIEWIRERNGIEIIGIKPSNQTCDGKFKYENISIKELKLKCKENGLKKYSSLSKIKLVKLLMTI